MAREEDIVFAEAGGVSLKRDVYRPETGAANRAAILYFHGGGWRGGSHKSVQPDAREMAATATNA